MMTKKNNGKFASKFCSTTPSDGRRENVRNERAVKEDLPKVSINFKDFDSGQCPPGQLFEDWQKDKLLAKLMDKFITVCSYNIIEVQQEGLLKIYGDFPKDSEFTVPSHVQGNVKWATVQKIGGQKPRLAGYVIDSTFYPVFLDKNHKFFPTKKK